MTDRRTAPGRLAVSLGLLALPLFPTPAPAATHLAATSSARDFLAGEGKGTAVTADGKLTLGQPFLPRAWPEDAADAVVFGAASDAAGSVFVATGGGLGRLFASEPGGGVSLVFTAPEPNLTAVAVASDGTVVCASSPNGKIYRVDPKAKSGTEWGDPKEAAIWSLAFAPDGSLFAGTGNKGRIYRRKKDGAFGLFHETEDVHVRTLAAGPDGTVYAGTSDRGLLLAIAPGGAARTLHDFSRPEVVGIAVRADGTVYAAASTAEPPPVASGPGDSKRALAPAAAPPKEKEETPKGTVSVSTGPARLAPSGREGREGSAEIVAVQPDGLVESAWSLPEETIYSLRLDPKSGDLILTTGPKGRVYSWKDRHLRLEAQTEQKQVVSAPTVANGFAAVTMNAAGVLRPAPGGKPASGTFVSAVKDVTRASLFGRLRHEGSIPAGASVSFQARAGNSEKPDATWSSWQPLDGGAVPRGAPLPVARYFQWKAELTASAKGEAPVLERVEFSYSERNARPILENLAVLEPGAVFSRSGSAGSAVLSVANPDELGIYAGLEPAREAAGETGKKLYRKGYRTVTWKGTDPNGDPLRYDLEARREGGSTWFLIRRDLEDSYYSFDTTALPDGRYRFRVTASDRLGNADGQALSAVEESAVALVDNTPPSLKIEGKRVDGGEIELRVVATDAASPITKAEGAVNADRWRLLTAEDGAADSTTERIVLRVPKPPRASVLSIRVVDAAGNAASISAEFPRDFE